MEAKKLGRKYSEDADNDFFDPVLDFDNLDDWQANVDEDH